MEQTIHILVVDDEPDIRRILHIMLEHQGYRVHEAINGRRAVEYIRENPDTDLILMDIMMPELGGVEASREIRSISSAPILFLTQKEFEILRELLTHQGRILTRQNLLDKLWRFDFYGDERVVDTHIKNLRKKLGIDFIQTIRGVGYKVDKEN